MSTLSNDAALAASGFVLPASNLGGNLEYGRFTPKRDEMRRRRQRDENTQIQSVPKSHNMPPRLSLDAMQQDFVWIATGEQVASIHDPGLFLSWSEFRSLTSASVTAVKKKVIPTALLWQKSTLRKTVLTRTFRPGSEVFCEDPDGRSALNTWRPIIRKSSVIGVGLFVEQVAFLFPDVGDRETFLNWLSHIEQRPGELPHYGWLHIAAHTGTGRNWLASLLARLWRGYVAPNVDLPALLDSQFNGDLAGRILAVVDEVQEAAGENPYRHTNRLKSLVNAEFRQVNPKYGRQYREHNVCRWLVFSNHLNALPIDLADRRWWIVHHQEAPRPPDAYSRLYCALDDPAFVDAIGAYLRDRDIAGFNPGERPPVSVAKLAVVDAGKSLIQQNAEHLIKHWPADVITYADAATVLSDGETNQFKLAMRRALEELGCAALKKRFRICGRPQRAWALRRAEVWISKPPCVLKSEIMRAYGSRIDTDALSVLADANEVSGF